MKLPWRQLHFTGIGGVGMAALAQAVAECGVRVTGSDAVESRYTNALGKAGIEVTIGHRDTLPAGTELLVFSSAISPDNSELAAARAQGIPCLRRGEFLGQFAACFPRVVAVSGSHGKTTTTAMLAHILHTLGRKPGFLVGGAVNGWETNGSAGNGELLVTEVDESDGTQVFVRASIAIVLNIDDDHCWSHGGEQALEQCFLAFAEQAQVILTWHSPATDRLLAGKTNVRFLEENSALPSDWTPPVPGHHNRLNAAIAVAAAELLGVSSEDALAVLASFPGVDRRLTRLFASFDSSHLLLEDYAHHPTELRATLETLRTAHPQHFLHIVFQPHRRERVRRYGQEFVDLLAQYADQVTIVSTFSAWTNDDDGSDGSALVAALNARRPQLASFAAAPDEALVKTLLRDFASRDNCLLAIVGAGDIHSLALRLQERLR